MNADQLIAQVLEGADPDQIVEAILTERNVGNLYLFSRDPIQKRVGVVTLSPEEVYREWKRKIGRGSLVYQTDRYIYKTVKPINVFIPNHGHVRTAVKKGLITRGEVASSSGVKGFGGHGGNLNGPSSNVLRAYYDNGGMFEDGRTVYDLTDDEFVEVLVQCLKAAEYHEADDVAYYLDRLGLSRVWGAYQFDDTVFAVADTISSSLDLIDGTVKRGERDDLPDPSDELLPEDVLYDLMNYTFAAEKELKPKTIKYLQRHYPSKGTLTLYRGFNKVIRYPSDYRDKFFLALFGVKRLDQIRVGAKVVYDRAALYTQGKDHSSWSYTPQMAAEFSRTADIEVLLKARVPGRKVIIDMARLHREDQEKFPFLWQNEVIVDGKVNAKISQLKLQGGTLLSWLKEQGYEYVPRKGIVKA